jgi:hypothetical protein
MAKVPRKVAGFVEKKRYITVDEIVDRFGYKRTTAYAYLSRLEKEGILTRIGYGRYKVGRATLAEPRLTPRMKSIGRLIREKIPFGDFVIWDMENLAEFSHYAIGRNVVFIEAGGDLVSKIGDALLEQGIRPMIEPTKEELGKLFTYFEEPVLILKRREVYATERVDNLLVPRFERMLVDLYFLITRMGFPFPPDELGRILYNVLRDRALNLDRLKKYASRRGLKEEISLLLRRLREEYPELDIPIEEGRGTEKMIEEIVKGAV